MCDLIAELSAPPTISFPDWDAVIDASWPFRIYFDASVHGLAPLLNKSNWMDQSEWNWSPLDLEAGSTLWSIQCLRACL